jgi:mono/diheme cytochrome c family protein
VSDDHAGVIWRIARGEVQARTAPAPARRPEPVALDPAAVERGRRLYEQHDCGSCHDPARAAPGTAARPLVQLRARHDAGSLAALLETPPPPMPAAPLSLDERADLAQYLLATAP